jgi:hypothetical protein
LIERIHHEHAPQHAPSKMASLYPGGHFHREAA